MSELKSNATGFRLWRYVLYHNGTAGFSFADGHSEIKKWLDNSTLKPNRQGGIGGWPLIVTEPIANDWH